MNGVARIGALTLAAFVAAGCAVTRDNQSTCKGTATVVGVILGGTAAGVATGEATGEVGAGAGAGVGGAAIGGIVGWLLGDHLCQVPEAPPPPPPPPAAAPAPAPGRRIETLTGPSFAFNKATLTPEGRQHVDHAVEILRDNPNIAVSVEGHTDSVGSDAYNMKLSQRRADAVRSYMVAHGISAGRITTAAFGETRPVATNDTAEGRAENRRVEIIVR